MNPRMYRHELSLSQRIAPILDTQCMVIMVCHKCHMLHQLNTKYDHMILFKGRNKQQVYDILPQLIMLPFFLLSTFIYI